jgi:hypothetical protein
MSVCASKYEIYIPVFRTAEIRKSHRLLGNNHTDTPELASGSDTPFKFVSDCFNYSYVSFLGLLTVRFSTGQYGFLIYCTGSGF